MLKLSLRDLRAHLGRYVLTFLAVTIGVGFVAGVVTLVDTIVRTFDDLYAGLNAGTDVAVRGEGQFDLGAELGGGIQRPRIAAHLAEEVAAVDGVAAAEGYVQGYARPISADGTPYGNPTFGAPTIGTNWGLVDELNPFELVEGRRPDAPDEIVFDKLTADRTGYRVGDVASVQTAGASPRRPWSASPASAGPTARPAWRSRCSTPRPRSCCWPRRGRSTRSPRWSTTGPPRTR